MTLTTTPLLWETVRITHIIFLLTRTNSSRRFLRHIIRISTTMSINHPTNTPRLLGPLTARSRRTTRPRPTARLSHIRLINISRVSGIRPFLPQQTLGRWVRSCIRSRRGLTPTSPTPPRWTFNSRPRVKPTRGFCKCHLFLPANENGL
jgi:hypothetical protein